MIGGAKPTNDDHHFPMEFPAAIAQCGIESFLWPTFQAQFLAKTAEIAQSFTYFYPLEKFILGYKCGYLPQCVQARLLFLHTLFCDVAKVGWHSGSKPKIFPYFTTVVQNP